MNIAHRKYLMRNLIEDAWTHFQNGKNLLVSSKSQVIQYTNMLDMTVAAYLMDVSPILVFSHAVISGIIER